jgi:hypothetical protein
MGILIILAWQMLAKPDSTDSPPATLPLACVRGSRAPSAQVSLHSRNGVLAWPATHAPHDAEYD